ncbi:MAG: TIGR04053 family radical SAM/SPASM domain-containing protein [Acidobacteriota bacterium]
MTQACALACRHCRAEAMSSPQPDELTFDESIGLLDQFADFGDPLPHLILTGGDPLLRADLFRIIAASRTRGIGVSITPAATAALTLDVLKHLRDAGVEGLGLSLDGSTASAHDAIRGVPGTYARTMQAIERAESLELPIQINTLAAAETAHDISAIYEVLKPHSIARWSLFFLISVGRGKVLQPLSPTDSELLMSWIYGISKVSPFIVATTEAPSYRRVAIELMRAEGLTGEQMKGSGPLRGAGIRDGHGIMFVSNSGEICPAGFLPISAGNIRTHRLAEVYREAPLFKSLHDPRQFEDRCGYCEYNALCGGSRARAFEATGTPLGTDPLCLYTPRTPAGGGASS